MGNSDIINMLSISEEINLINFKIGQILRDLESRPETRPKLKSLLSNMNDKISDLVNKTESFIPNEIEEEKIDLQPSYVTENKEQENVDFTVPPIPESKGNNLSPDTVSVETDIEEVVEEEVVEEPIVPKKPLKRSHRQMVDKKGNRI